jgi:RHS repeat-associated protein
MKSLKLAQLVGAGLALLLFCMGHESVQAQTLYFIEADHLNTPRLVADRTGATVWRWDNQEPFGNDVPNEDPGNTGNPIVVPLRFSGQYFDKETNIAYNYFRDYDPNIGRYIESDPIGLSGGFDTYSYVNSNPSIFVDREGLAGENPIRRIPFPAPHVVEPISSTSGPYCPFPSAGSFPKSVGGGRTNTTGRGNPYTTFIKNSGPGPYTINPTYGGGTRITAPGAGGGTTQIRQDPGEPLRVDVHPGGNAVPETIHFPD